MSDAQSVGGKWSAPISLAQHRISHSATLLPTGHVLIVGGGRCRPCDGNACDVENVGSSAQVEVFDPVKGVSVPIRPLANPREGHHATLLSDGSVLVSGGLLDIG